MTPACLLMLWPLVLLLCSPATSIKLPQDYDWQNLPQPPEFGEQPQKEIVVYPNDEVTLKCKATGNPELTYRWTKDGVLFHPQQEPGVTQLNGSGTLVITTNNGNVATRFRGVYRCYASNELGTAMSTEGRIVAESAPQWPKEKVAHIVVEEEASVILPCNPPTSADPPKIYWLNSKIEHIAQNERVTMGQDGNLYFANVEMSDSHPDYICNAHFQSPRLIIQKEPIELKVQQTNSFQIRKPRLMLPSGSSSTYVALQGETLVLECIVEGFPTPSLRWSDIHGLMPSGRIEFDNYNKTLRILNVTEYDDGEYECIAQNKHGTVNHKYYVTVEAAPYWMQKPVSQLYGPGEDVRLNCKVYGKPKPKVTWKINGVPWKDLQPDPRRTLNHEGSLIFSKVQQNDTAVIQCLAHNKHGSILANAYIHVVRLPAQILTENGIHYRVVVNQTAILHCKTFGAPGPTVTWFTEDLSPALGDGRMFAHTNGTLEIEQVQLDDSGNFTCMAANDQNNVSIIAQLIVKEPTQLEVKPTYIEEKTGSRVTFHCMVQCDKSLKCSIKWLRDGQEIKKADNHVKYFINETSLTITNLDYPDKGTYSCLAQTDFDSVEKSAMLLVVGKPGPVSYVEVVELQDWQVKLTWTPADDHNSPIEKYVVFAEEGYSEPEKWKWVTNVPGNQLSTILRLSPYEKYCFKVQAKNKHGDSEDSPASEHFETKPAAPERNPTEVTGKGNETDNMIIAWKPLPHIDWNAPEVKYHVQWRLKGQSQWNETEVKVPPVVVTDTPVFSPYEIKVQTRNDFGKGPEPRIFLGYSGEKIPEATPENVAVEVINCTAIKLSWVLPDKEKVWGHLKGFKVYYTRLGSAAERSRRQARSHAHRPHLVIEGDVREGILGGFRPWSQYQVQMTVLNGRGEGPPSDSIDFVTPEGVPSRPESFHLDYLSDTELMLEWTPPRFPNGILQKYVLTYQQVNQSANQTEVGIIRPINIPATQLAFPLRDLTPQIPYKFFLWAETREGPGEPFVLEEHTMRESVNLSFMNISLGATGENFTTIIWTPNPNQRDIEFAVHILSKTDDEWHVVGKATSNQGSYSIPDLQPGKQYVVRLVKVHRTGDDQTIWETEVETNGMAHEHYESFAKEGWFIGFVSAIILLILVLVLLCFIKRSKGGKYSVKDKEDTHVDSEARPMKDETFGEYSDNEEKPFTSSQPSLNGDIKALGSDDSLADYGGSVDVQFNEDGSFIGQYSGQKGKEGGGNDSSGATSPTNVAAALE